MQCLLEGDSEKQVAARLRVSKATVHEYVKALYRRFNVASRPELLARWVRFDRRPSGTRNCVPNCPEADKHLLDRPRSHPPNDAT